jgi:hypothetical protein
MNLEALDCKTRAFSWEELRAVVSAGRLDLLGRSDEQQCAYDAFAADLRLVWHSPSDYLLFSKFGVSYHLDGDGRRRAANAVSDSDSSRLALVPNDFPYHFEPGIQHFILWKLGGEALKQSEVDDATNTLTSGAAAKDALFWVNPAHLKSVLDIDHAHLIVRDLSCLDGPM